MNQHTYVDELILIDINKERIVGEAMDLNHCLAYSPSRVTVKVGEYEDNYSVFHIFHLLFYYTKLFLFF